MKENKPLDTKTLLEEAKNAEHKEAYRTLEKNQHYRIGIGVRLTPPNTPSFFIEILLYLCPNSTNVNLKTLEKNLTCLKTLRTRNYTLTCQDDNCVSCEKTILTQHLTREYSTIKALMVKIFS
jgi:hypothetical protein